MEMNMMQQQQQQQQQSTMISINEPTVEPTTEPGDIEDSTNAVEFIFAYLKAADKIQKFKTDIQQIRFSDKFGLKDYRLIQVTKEIAESAAVGEKLIFRGLDDDPVVLCTESETYSVKHVETRGTLLVTTGVIDPDEKFLDKTTVAVLSLTYLELKKKSLHSLALLRQLSQMEELLWEWPNANTNDNNLYTLEDIRSVVQMSDNELSYVMDQMPIVEHFGKVRWMSNDLQDKLLDLIVEAFDDPEMTSVSLTHLTAQALRSFLPENVTDAIIHWFLRKICKRTGNGDYDVDADALCRARAAQLLRSAPEFEIDDFHKRVEAMMPFGINFNSSVLSDISIQHKNAIASYISYLSVEELPPDPRDRLKTLFSKQREWKLDVIRLFFSDICRDEYELDVFLIDTCNYIQLEDRTVVLCSMQRV
ncbi:hypothetical protein KIN20_012546 [Parelaphostrongylus tenuis]|uniref:Sister chromatid cohesion protein DCC1 n=1 Tax=Parelaphostrongylus tenuis TaxID=148309 RepID=A0AAD5MEB6_PARTN|nr:hypothetical protein KIN20_012546 [Parelaphostrongylus tenuis]